MIAAIQTLLCCAEPTSTAPGCLPLTTCAYWLLYFDTQNTNPNFEENSVASPPSTEAVPASPCASPTDNNVGTPATKFSLFKNRYALTVKVGSLWTPGRGGGEG
jgi:hypothetical protein